MFAIKLKDGRLTSNYNKKRAAIFKIDNSKKELLEKKEGQAFSSKKQDYIVHWPLHNGIESKKVQVEVNQTTD